MENLYSLTWRTSLTDLLLMVLNVPWVHHWKTAHRIRLYINIIMATLNSGKKALPISQTYLFPWEMMFQLYICLASTQVLPVQPQAICTTVLHCVWVAHAKWEARSILTILQTIHRTDMILPRRQDLCMAIC